MEKLTFSHVYKGFRNGMILEDVNMEFAPGKIYGFIGPNGSGKTVILKMAAGLLCPTKGSIYLDSQMLGRNMDFPPSMGVLIENPGFLAHDTGLQNLLYLTKIKGLIGKREVEEAMDKVGILYAANQRTGQYSLGMKQRLGIAQVIMENPELLILDEPMNGLDQKGIAEIRALLLEQKSQGKLILLASHAQEDIKLLCDQIYVIQDKRTQVMQG
ncbi:MAG: ATP-binding cassette domain-containing protein [Eubacteriales bacterium]|nr:ATP-binding cassette domain-containing protein [Eubacteriales bacterium]